MTKLTFPERPKATKPRAKKALERKGRRARAVLNPPVGLEASLLHLGQEELLVLRVPLVRPEPRTDLSAAEREVAELALAGLSNAEIGRRRRTSARTVANQIATIFRKLGVGSRAQLAHCLVAKTGR